MCEDTHTHTHIVLKYVIEGNIEERIEVVRNEDEDVSSYWMTLRKREGTLN